MTVSVTHAFHSGVADSGDPAIVQPSNWNAAHSLTGTAKSVLFLDSAGHLAEDPANFNYDQSGTPTLEVPQLVVSTLLSVTGTANFNGPVNFSGSSLDGVGIGGHLEVIASGGGADSTPLVAFYGSNSTYDGCIQSYATDVWSLGFITVDFATLGPSVLAWDKNSHVLVGNSTAPAVDGGATISGTDLAGVITLGAAQTSVNLTFHTAFAGTPYVVIAGQSGTAVAYTVSTAGIGVSSAGAADKLNYMVLGRVEG
jgi:hypothetical protein